MPPTSDPRPSPAFSRKPSTSSRLVTAPSFISSTPSAPAHPLLEDMNLLRVSQRRWNGLQGEFLSKLGVTQPLACSTVKQVPIHA
jgi:hypothetical protein